MNVRMQKQLHRRKRRIERRLDKTRQSRMRGADIYGQQYSFRFIHACRKDTFNGLPFTDTLGCGTWAGNITSDNKPAFFSMSRLTTGFCSSVDPG